MRFSRKQRKKKSFETGIVSLLIYSAAFILIIFLIVSNFRIMERRADIAAQIDRGRAQIYDLKDRLDKEEDDISDEYRIERIIREQLLMKKEGEEVVFITFPEEEIEEKEEKTLFLWWNPLTWKER